MTLGPNTRIVNRCHRGQVTKAATGTTSNGFPYAGTFRVRCDECGGKGCDQAQAARDELAAMAEGLSVTQVRRLTAAMRKAAGPA